MRGQTETTEQIAGHITRVAFHGNGFLIAKLEGGETVKGQMLEVQDGVAHTFRGRWEEDAKWGKQFHFESYETELPRDTVGIERYLMQNARWVGPEIARRLTDAYGEDTLQLCKEEPERVATEINGLSRKRADEIAEMLRRNEALEQVSVKVESLVASAGLSRSVVNRIIKLYREEAP